ncbi:DUF1045 domain-containing protein [Pararhizobium mangrovi]|uniref:DUF1045 domain-containing protein n=1 Tax=Pararhizobium mangrovi TaxID=2590452 RepID=A0A506U413_9HYPH|nr:DUF1045 domain-containing protein [Pararhizobium mangrovi]TPW26617.1 DUF1045 domain-containing protein [Pararhizobium mangrovi]
MRYAIYFTPPAHHPLTRLASRWLGRSAFTDNVLEPPAVAGLSPDDIAHYTAAPRRYGFHGTLKAPFALDAGVSEGDMMRALMAFCAGRRPIAPAGLRIAEIGPFFALVPSAPEPELNALADGIVRDLDGLRAPLSDAEIERRNPERLSRTELANLHRWGYPHVFDAFRFHMTLTGAVEPSEREAVRTALDAVFEPVLREPMAIDTIALFVETTPGAPFIVHSLHPLGAAAVRKTA